MHIWIKIISYVHFSWKYRHFFDKAQNILKTHCQVKCHYVTRNRKKKCNVHMPLMLRKTPSMLFFVAGCQSKACRRVWLAVVKAKYLCCPSTSQVWGLPRSIDSVYSVWVKQTVAPQTVTVSFSIWSNRLLLLLWLVQLSLIIYIYTLVKACQIWGAFTPKSTRYWNPSVLWDPGIIPQGLLLCAFTLPKGGSRGQVNLPLLSWNRKGNQQTSC